MPPVPHCFFFPMLVRSIFGIIYCTALTLLCCKHSSNINTQCSKTKKVAV